MNTIYYGSEFITIDLDPNVNEYDKRIINFVCKNYTAEMYELYKKVGRKFNFIQLIEEIELTYHYFGFIPNDEFKEIKRVLSKYPERK
jgi:hypothetical protein